MKYIDEYKDRKTVQKLAKKIAGLNVKANLMDVCGTHTTAFFRYGIRSLLPKGVNLLSGPGCPVCVTDDSDIDAMIKLADIPDAVITTFGDMMRVPGSKVSLNQKKASGADIRVVYSPLDALSLAKELNPRPVIFLGVGFETTAPTVAATIVEAHSKGVNNFHIYSAHKLVPPAIRAVLDAKDVNIDGFILPGHVSTIIGAKPYEFISREYDIPSVIAGFEPLDLMGSAYELLRMINGGDVEGIEIEYARVVKPEGNIIAQKVMKEVFEVADASWRGLGTIKKSGLEIRNKYSIYDAKKVFKVKPSSSLKNKTSCICGSVLRGVKTPIQCKLFGKACTPENPKGPCMVSTEGACAAYYKYGRK
jgi:hydrogenase expression/formation protein HypD